MNQSISTIFYQTTDLALATTITLSYPLDSIDRTIPSKSQFIFKREAGLDELIEQYWRGELRVDPKRYFEQIRMLKSRLYEDR